MVAPAPSSTRPNQEDGFRRWAPALRVGNVSDATGAGKPWRGPYSRSYGLANAAVGWYAAGVFDYCELEAFVKARGQCPPEQLRLSGSKVAQLRRDGLTEIEADRYACRCGAMPFEIWPDWYQTTDPTGLLVSA